MQFEIAPAFAATAEFNIRLSNILFFLYVQLIFKKVMLAT